MEDTEREASPLSSFLLKQTKKKNGSRIVQNSKGLLSVNLFDFPPDLLVRNHIDGSQPLVKEVDIVDVSECGKGLTCRGCGLEFEDRLAQQSHFKSPLHLQNLRRKALGQQPVQEFEDGESGDVLAAADGLDTIPGSESERSDDESQSDNEVEKESEKSNLEESSNWLTGAQERNSSYGVVGKEITPEEGPQIIYMPRGSEWQYRVCPALLDSNVDPWQELASLTNGGEGGRLWAVIMLSSGRFAGAIFEGKQVLEHKTFRRYTVRAKQGGSQKSYDSGGRKAQSIGSQLRRYGEQALKDEVRALLQVWRPLLCSCRGVLLSVPRTMRNVLFEETKGREPVLVKSDPRVRSIPFVADRPTLEEAVAIHARVMTISFKLQQANDLQDTNESKSPQKKGAGSDAPSPPRTSTSTPVVPPPSPEPLPELPECPPLNLLLNACRCGDEEGVVAALKSCEDGTFDETWDPATVISMPDGLEQLATALHIASEGGFSNVVSKLLECGADPCKKDIRGRTPYMLTKDKKVRDVYRRYRSAAEDQWDWEAAHVPAALTPELEQAQKEREKEKKKQAKGRKKEANARQEEEKRENDARLAAEAEERAAEEARMLEALRCGGCGKPVRDKNPLHVFDVRCCSSTCIQLVKRKLAAQAAERRLQG